MSGRPDTNPDVLRMADYWTGSLSAPEAVNLMIQDLKETGGGVIEFQRGMLCPIDSSIRIVTSDITFRGFSSPSSKAGSGGLKLTYDGPIFEIPADVTEQIGGIRFEGLLLDGLDGSAGEHTAALKVNTGQFFHQWISFDWCHLIKFRRAIEITRKNDGSRAVGKFHVTRSAIGHNEQSFVCTNGAQINIFSAENCDIKGNNRDCKYPAANHISGQSHEWRNINVENSGNAILYDDTIKPGNSSLKFSGFWMEKCKGDFVVRLVRCFDHHIGHDFRHKPEMASPIQLHQCGRGQCWPDALVTEPK